MRVGSPTKRHRKDMAVRTEEPLDVAVRAIQRLQWPVWVLEGEEAAPLAVFSMSYFADSSTPGDRKGTHRRR